MIPDSWRKGGLGPDITYGLESSSIGQILVAVTNRGLDSGDLATPKIPSSQN